MMSLTSPEKRSGRKVLRAAVIIAISTSLRSHSAWICLPHYSQRSLEKKMNKEALYLCYRLLMLYAEIQIWTFDGGRCCCWQSGTEVFEL
jgi:hypothetical protein